MHHLPLRAPSRSACRAAALAAGLLLVGCHGVRAQTSNEWPASATKWYERASASYEKADIDDAEFAIENASRLLPEDHKVRLMAAKIALASLEFERAVGLLVGLDSLEARGVRSRALWYGGKLEAAADELDEHLANPDVRDPWAKDIAKLARHGVGRTPFELSGALLGWSEMPNVGKPALVVPLEVNGEPALGLIATNMPEAVLDSSTGMQPSWVSLRFGEKLEVRNVPALTQDLSGVSRSLNAPIKILLGVNVLRHLHATFDYSGSQFVVRSFEPPPPPHATTVRLSYARGGGMVMRGQLGTGTTAKEACLAVDTTLTFPLALDEDGWKKANIPLSQLRPVAGAEALKQGVLPVVQVGAFEIPQVPAVLGAGIAQLEEGLGLNLDGLLGAGMFAPFRVTLADGGRRLWLEDNPMDAGSREEGPPAPGTMDLPGPAQPPGPELQLEPPMGGGMLPPPAGLESLPAE